MAAGCGGVKVTPAPLFDAGPLASPCLLEQDSNTVILRDYFPTLPTMDTTVITAASEDPWLRYLEVTTADGQKGVLVVKNMLPGKMAAADPSLAPFMTTAAVPGQDDRFLILIENEADDVQVLWQNTLLDKDHGIRVVDRNTLEITVPRNARKMERSFIRAFCADEEGGLGNDILVPLERGRVVRDAGQLRRSDKHAQVLYSFLIDRFVNGRSDNDMPLGTVNPKVDYWGGDLAGVTQTLESGYFDSLGVTTIWLSPITQNPFTAWGRIHDPETQFSGYHGYWPYYTTAIDVRYGTDAELRELLDKAHADNKNVILDYVSNHMHVESPTLTAHPDWTTPSDTPDGRPNRQLYDEFRLTTWFDDHIPTLDLERPEICAQLTDSALFWMQNYDFDGFRHDATKHVPEQYWRMLTRKLCDSLPGRSFYQIGETYGSTALINSYVKPGMQDAQFDFNVYDTYIWATTSPEGSFEGLASRLSEDMSVYGSHHLMGNITGNHDRPRYICLASGDIDPDEDDKLAGWHRDIKVTDPVGYKKLQMLHALNFTIPGVPCIYYGDEFGQPGANDPDNRRWMQFDGLTPLEEDVREAASSLAHLRTGSMPLLYGDYRLLHADTDVLAYSRSYMGETVVTVLNKGEEPCSLSLTLPCGLTVDGKNETEVTVAPMSYLILK